MGGSLRNYALTRLALTIPMVLILLTVVFVLMRVVPGDPIQSALGGHAPPSVIAEKRHEAGFDRPVTAQYVSYLKQVFSGNFGTTLTDDRRVVDIVRVNGAATLELTVGALLVALLVGAPLGLLAGRRRGGAFDAATRLGAIVTYAMPTFFLGLLAQLLLGRWLPTSGEASALNLATVPAVTHMALVDSLLAGNLAAAGDAFRHLILPACTLGLRDARSRALRRLPGARAQIRSRGASTGPGWRRAGGRIRVPTSGCRGGCRWRAAARRR
jgi:peptide/nickel transport system permease protein